MKIQLEHGITVHTYPVPPSDFDLDRASDRDRLKYGIPRCPVEFPELAKRWEAKLKKRRIHIVPPVFRKMDYKRHHLIKLNEQHGVQTTSVWSGGIVFPPSGDKMKWVEGNLDNAK
jgi:hypothetical protein